MKKINAKIAEIFRTDKIIGLDIGAGSVKMIQLIKKENGLHLEKAEVKEIARTGDEALQKKEVGKALKDIVRQSGARKSRVFVTIDSPETAVKVTRTPYMPKGELNKGVNLEAASHFPFSIQNSVLDFEVLRDVVEKGVKKYEIAVAVSPKKTVTGCLSMLKENGIKPVLLVPCAYALHKLAEHAYLTPEETVSFINIGETCSELIIFKGPALMFTRKIPITGRDFTKALMGALSSDRGRTELTFEEAEKIKKEVGIPPDGEERIIDGKISTTQIRSMLMAPMEQFLSEIERSFDYYREETGGGKIDSVVLFGGGAALTGFTRFLSEGLGVKVTIGDPLEDMKATPDAVSDRARISYRLAGAVGAVFSSKRGINLLPPEMKEETKRIFSRALIQGIITAILLGSVLIYVGMRIQLSNFRKRIAVAEMEYASLQPQFKKAEAHHLANMVLVDEPHWEDIFRELSHRIPDDIYFTGMTLDKGVMEMKGIVKSRDGEQQLSDFTISLNRGVFSDVKLVKTRDLQDQEGIEFVLRGRVD